MTTTAAVRAILALVSLGGMGVALGFAVVSTPRTELAVERFERAPAEAVPHPAGDSLARAIVTRNPFRVHRTAALVRYSAATAAGIAGPPPPAIQRPALVLAGVLLGDDPVALVDGLPGFEHTRALRVGETVAGYRLRELTAERAVIVGPDTTFVLAVRTRSP